MASPGRGGPSAWSMPHTSSASMTGDRACPFGVSRYHTSRWLAASRSTIPCSSSARRRALSHLGVIEASVRSEEHTSELQSLRHLVCRLLLEKKKKKHRKRDQRHARE